MNIVWRSQAEDDLFALVEYIALDSPQAALRIYETIRTSVNQLAIFPNSAKSGRLARTRELVIPGLPYIVIYAIIREEVQILAVHHGAREWPNDLPIDE